jgi:hypothetical protein
MVAARNRARSASPRSSEAVHRHHHRARAGGEEHLGQDVEAAVHPRQVGLVEHVGHDRPAAHRPHPPARGVRDHQPEAGDVIEALAQVDQPAADLRQQRRGELERRRRALEQDAVVVELLDRQRLRHAAPARDPSSNSAIAPAAVDQVAASCPAAAEVIPLEEPGVMASHATTTRARHRERAAVGPVTPTARPPRR